MGGYTQHPNQMGLNPQQGMYPYVNNSYSRVPCGGFGLNVNQHSFNQSTHNPFTQTKLPFLATFELIDLSKLTNDPIQHHFSWPPIHVKIPTDIPKFDGKTKEEPANPITTYHLWCLSNFFWMIPSSCGYSLELLLGTWPCDSLNYQLPPFFISNHLQ